MYKDKYHHIIIKINNVEESHIFQQLLFSMDITWGGDRRIYNDGDCYFVASITQKENSILFYEPDELSYLKSDNITDGVVYTIDDIIKIKQIIRSSLYTPNYKPKRIKREV